jgi:hypothetical protein
MFVIGDACAVQKKETTWTRSGGHHGEFVFQFHQQ